MAETSGITRRDLFRFAAASGVTTAVGLNLGEGGARAAAAQDPVTPLTPQAALAEMQAGNARFVANTPTSLSEDALLIAANTEETRHTPFAAVLSCADARVPPEFVFDQAIGRLFVTRVAGNIATPEIIASLEYAAVALPPIPPAPPITGVRLIVVLGHGLCGAVTSASRVDVAGGQISALYAPLRLAVVLGGSNVLDGGTADPARVDAAIQFNARIQATLLRDSSPVLSDLVKKNRLLVVAAYYNLVTTQVTFLDI